MSSTLGNSYSTENQILACLDKSEHLSLFYQLEPVSVFPGRTMVLRMAPKPSNPFQPTFLVSLVRDVQVNGQKTNLLFNTGVATSLAFSSSRLRR
jgi:hypothetical protein